MARNQFAPLLHVDRIQGLWRANPFSTGLLSRNVWTVNNAGCQTLNGVGEDMGLVERVQMLRACSAYVSAKLFLHNMPVTADMIQTGVAIELGACMMPDGASLTANAAGVVALREQIAVFLAAPEGGRADPIEQWTGVARDVLFGAEVGRIVVPAENATFAAHVNFLINVGSRLRAAMLPTLFQILAIIIIGYGKRGQTTPAFLARVNRELTAATNREIQVTRDQVSQFYSVVAPHINPENAQRINERLRELTVGEPVALRLNLIAQRMSGSGLMAFINIGRAIRAFPGFNWNRVAAILQGEWANYQQALALVGGNMFFGFSADLGAARSTRFKSLAYVATYLFQICYGQEAAAGYAGFAQGVHHQPLLQQMVRDFQVVRDQEIAAIVVGHQADVVVAAVNGEENNVIFAVDQQ